MFRTACKYLACILIFSFGTITQAFAASQEAVPTFADIAETLISGTDFITRLMLAAAMILGAGFVIFAISTYRQHRMTPKLVPLDRPVLYLVLGLSLCSLPFLGDIFGAKTYSTLDLRKQGSHIFSSAKSHANNSSWDIDAPLEVLEDVIEEHR